MVTLEQYVGPHADSPDWTDEREANAVELLEKVNALQAEMEADGVVFPVNPKTGSQISGTTFGGFRPQDCPQGAPDSNHKKGQGIDLYDPKERIDNWCVAHQDRLKFHGICIEHPSKTGTWSHWQSVPPKSGKTVYFP